MRGGWSTVPVPDTTTPKHFEEEDVEDQQQEEAVDSDTLSCDSWLDHSIKNDSSLSTAGRSSSNINRHRHRHQRVKLSLRRTVKLGAAVFLIFALNSSSSSNSRYAVSAAPALAGGAEEEYQDGKLAPKKSRPNLISVMHGLLPLLHFPRVHDPRQTARGF